MLAIKNWLVKCKKENERTTAKVGQICEVKNDFLYVDDELETNFWNCCRRFVKLNKKDFLSVNN